MPLLVRAPVVTEAGTYPDYYGPTYGPGGVTPGSGLPAAPGSVQLRVSPGQVTVLWLPSAAAVSYRVLRDGQLVGTVTATSFTDTGVPSGTHAYAVAAVNDVGSGPASVPVVVYVPAATYLPSPRQLRLTSGTGEVLVLTDRENGYRVRRGVRGLGMPPTDLQRRGGAGDGSRWQRTRREERVVDLPVQVEGSTTEVFAERMQRLMEALDDRYGPPTLTVLRPDGTARSIEVRYAGGAEWEDGEGTGGPLLQLMPLTLVAPDPYFRSTEPVSLSIGTGAGQPFIPFGAPLVTAPSRVTGELELVNPGDADAYGVWTLTGPGGPWELRSVTDGVGFVYEGVLVAGETVVVDTDAKTVRGGDGSNRYDQLGPAPRLWAIPPGRSRARVEVTDSTGATTVGLTFFPRWKTGS